MPIPLGILAQAGRSIGVASDYELIESVILTSTQSSVTFSNLGNYSSTYQHLQIRYVARSDYNGTGEALMMRLNGITSASYTRHRLLGNGSTVTSAGESSAQTRITGIGSLAGATASSGIFASGVIDILDPYEAKNKTVRALSGQSGGVTAIGLYSGALLSTDSVTSATLFSETSANFVQYSRFSLYGVK